MALPVTRAHGPRAQEIPQVSFANCLCLLKGVANCPCLLKGVADLLMYRSSKLVENKPDSY